MKTKDELLQQFRKAGSNASYHYADDTGCEWDSGRKYENEALQIFDNHPELEKEFRKIAKRFLWSLNMKRPTK